MLRKLRSSESEVPQRLKPDDFRVLNGRSEDRPLQNKTRSEFSELPTANCQMLTAKRQMRSASPSLFDLAVIGGGPAGSSAAITAARLGARVVLLEAREFPRHKVCGEFVSAEALGVLAGLLREAPSAKSLFDNAPVMDRTRLLRGNRSLEAPVLPAALSITRYDLDAALWKAAQVAGIETRANCEVVASDGDGPFRSANFRRQSSAPKL